MENGAAGGPSVGGHNRALSVLTTPEFVDEISARLGAARDRIIIQLMTFDGDDAGLKVAELLIEAAERGVEIRLLIDCFVEKGVSDVPVSRPEVADEFATTNEMYDRLRSSGVSIRFTHPTGPANLFTLVRNHKKLFVVDDIAYLGGVNVSDHNFAWHDFMVRIEAPEIVAALVDDFTDTENGGRQNLNQRIETSSVGPVTLVTNDEVEAIFDSLVASAAEEVIIASPYADDIGLCRVMAKNRRARRTLIVPKESNATLYRILSPYIRRRLRNLGVRFSSYPRFSHAKFLLVDDTHLLIGSSNFGRHSFWCNQEVCLLVSDPDFIARFRSALLDDLTPFDSETVSPVHLALGAVVAWGFHFGVVGLRHTVAGRVPALSPR